MFFRNILLFLFAAVIMTDVDAQPKDAIYDEAKVGDYTLPDPLKMEDGTPVNDSQMWREKRRPELLKLFETHVYGKSPGKPKTILFKKTSEDKNALGGRATRREVSITFKEDRTGPRLDVLMYIPNRAEKPVPAFLGLNFDGNHTVNKDPGISVTTNWVPNRNDRGITNNQATLETRGSSTGRWEAEKIVDSGFALVTIYAGDIDPDFDDGFKNGVHALYNTGGEIAPDAWGTVAAWAWGLSRALDYLETDRDINAKQVAVIGHSRLGKAALWAGATDERFAITISNNSGCGGAALSRRIFGETVGRINTSFPHWFCDNYNKYNNNENASPVDQHELLALIAPRSLYVASATEDLWADPKGEFLSAKHADPVYKLLGTDGLPTLEMPGADEPVMGTIGYHLRTGKHDVTAYDWEQYIKFANKHFGRTR